MEFIVDKYLIDLEAIDLATFGIRLARGAIPGANSSYCEVEISQSERSKMDDGEAEHTCSAALLAAEALRRAAKLVLSAAGKRDCAVCTQNGGLEQDGDVTRNDEVTQNDRDDAISVKDFRRGMANAGVCKYFCAACNKVIPMVSLSSHIINQTHMRNSRIAVPNPLYTMNVDDRFCTLCKVVANALHDEESTHLEKYNHMLEENKVTRTSDGFVCNVCECYMPRTAETYHVAWPTHIRRTKKLVETKHLMANDMTLDTKNALLDAAVEAGAVILNGSVLVEWLHRSVLVCVGKFHGVRNGRCLLCLVTGEMGEHVKTDKHRKIVSAKVDRVTLTRRVDDTWFHCIICDELVVDPDLHTKSNNNHNKTVHATLVKDPEHKDGYCHVCDIFIPDAEKKKHKGSAVHLSKTVSQKELHYLFKEKLPGTVECKVCEVEISAEKFHVDEHLEDHEHKRKYMGILQENSIKLYRDDFICSLCNVRIVKGLEMNHFKGKPHKKNLGGVVMASSNNNSSKWIKQTKKKFKCAICEVNGKKVNLAAHVMSEMHIRNVEIYDAFNAKVEKNEEFSSDEEIEETCVVNKTGPKLSKTSEEVEEELIVIKAMINQEKVDDKTLKYDVKKEDINISFIYDTVIKETELKPRKVELPEKEEKFEEIEVKLKAENINIKSNDYEVNEGTAISSTNTGMVEKTKIESIKEETERNLHREPQKREIRGTLNEENVDIKFSDDGVKKGDADISVIKARVVEETEVKSFHEANGGISGEEQVIAIEAKLNEEIIVTKSRDSVVNEVNNDTSEDEFYECASPKYYENSNQTNKNLDSKAYEPIEDSVKEIVEAEKLSGHDSKGNIEACAIPKDNIVNTAKDSSDSSNLNTVATSKTDDVEITKTYNIEEWRKLRKIYTNDELYRASNVFVAKQGLYCRICETEVLNTGHLFDIKHKRNFVKSDSAISLIARSVNLIITYIVCLDEYKCGINHVETKAKIKSVPFVPGSSIPGDSTSGNKALGPSTSGHNALGSNIPGHIRSDSNISGHSTPGSTASVPSMSCSNMPGPIRSGSNSSGLSVTGSDVPSSILAGTGEFQDFWKVLDEKMHMVLENVLAAQNAQNQKENVVKRDSELKMEQNDVKNQNKHYLMHFVTEDTVSCKVCKISLKNNEESIISHINHATHADKYQILLKENYMQRQNHDYFCELCKVVVKHKEQLVHMGSKPHKDVLDMKNLITEMDTLFNVKNAQNNCKVCNLHVPNNLQNIKQHVDGRYHRNQCETKLKRELITIAGDDWLCLICDREVKHYTVWTHVKDHANKRKPAAPSQPTPSPPVKLTGEYQYVYTYKNKQFVCNICGVKMTNNIRNMTEHINGGYHRDECEKKLKAECFSKLGQQWWCLRCEKMVEHLNVWTHINTVHKKTAVKTSTANENKRVVATNHPHSAFLCPTPQPSDVFCKICNTTLPNTKMNVESHLKGGRHENSYEDILRINKQTKTNNNFTYCSVCKVFLKIENLLEHNNKPNHKALL